MILKLRYDYIALKRKNCEIGEMYIAFKKYYLKL